MRCRCVPSPTNDEPVRIGFPGLVPRHITAPPHWIGGWYESRLRKGRKGWRFTDVRLHLKLMSPHADGWTTLPPAA